MKYQIGFLGAGNMAQGMIGRLLNANFSVRIYNRTPEKASALLERGAIIAATPLEAALEADAVISMVGDDEAARAVWLGDTGALQAATKPHAFAIECSTLSHGWVTSFGESARRAGYRPIDCPVTGLPTAAARGELRLLVGSSEEVLEAARPILAPLCCDIVRFGEHGAGTRLKLILNLMGAVQIAGAAEAMAMASAAGLDLERVLHIIANGVAGAPQVVRVAKNMVANDHESNITFSANWRLKDVRYGIGLANELHADAPLAQTTHALFARLNEMGLGNQNESVIVKAYQDWSAHR